MGAVMLAEAKALSLIEYFRALLRRDPNLIVKTENGRMIVVFSDGTEEELRP